MLQKIISTTALMAFLVSTVSAQEAPGNSLPVVSETAKEELILNSAPQAPKEFTSLSEIVVTPEADQAVFEFSTTQKIHASIEYGLTPEYDHSITTEPQTEHTETLGSLEQCARYYYQVTVGDEYAEGEFETLCPVKAKKVVQPVVKKIVKNVTPVVTEPVKSEEKIVLNAAPDVERDYPAQPVADQPEEDTYVSQDAQNVSVQMAPLPGPIAFGDKTVTQTPESAAPTPAVILLLALLGGALLMVAFSQKKKKWYQR